MHLPVADVNVPWLVVVLVGLFIGATAGFFGVGGGFLLTPLLNALFGVPYNVAVGSSLSQMVGLSCSGAIRHAELRNIDYRLGGIVLLVSMVGAEFGAWVVQALDDLGSLQIGSGNVPVITLAMSIIYAVLLSSVGVSVAREAMQAARGTGSADSEPDNKVIDWLRGIRLRPVLSLPASGIESVSLWVLVVVGLVVGFVSGLLGGGGGFILMPVLIYAMGCPTVIAIGTGTFQRVFTGGFAAYSHSLKGNVDLLLVVLMLLGSAAGAHIGAGLTRLFDASRVRGGFAVLCFIGVAVVVIKLVILLTGGG